MANSLLIEKQTGGYFKFTLNGDTANAVTSIQNDLLAVGNQLHFKTGNGANIIKEQFIYPEDVTIISGGTFTFTTVAQVWDKLIDIDYFVWLNVGSGGVDRFDDLVDTFKYTGNAGKTVVVDNSELRLVPITLYNKRLFTELEDTPSSLVPNKMLVVNPTGTAVVLQDQPEQPEQLLNSVGYFDYNDLITQTTPLNAVANVALKLTNDTEGLNTSTDQNPYGVSYVWDYTTNAFNFSELEIGDTIDVRIHVQVTTTTSNQKVDLKAKLGIGSASEFINTIYENQFKSAGLHEVNFVAPFYMGSTDITDYPAELYLTTDASATVIVDGWYVRILRKNINIITVDYTVPDATTTVKGIVRLAGDLSGTANNPTVPELANKVPNTRTVSTTSPLLGGGALSSNLTLSIQQANSVDSGYLSNVDWSTFNGKQAALNGTGFVKISGTTISYDNSTYALDGAVVKLAGAQTITGLKTFSNMPILSAASGVNGQIVYADASNQLKTITNFKYNDATGVLTTQLGDLGSNAYTSTAYQPLLTNPVTASTSTANYLSKFTGSGYAIGNSLIYDNGTNVGIGTTSPSGKLTISGVDAGCTIDIFNTGISQKYRIVVNTLSGALAFENNAGTETVRFNQNGNVGIGTTSPVSKLHVSFTSDSDGLRIQNSNRGNSYLLATAGGSAEFFSLYDLGSSQFLYFAGNSGHSWNTQGSERMRITSGGNVGIGTTSPSVKLHTVGSSEVFRLGTTNSINYFTFFNSSGTQIGDIGYDGRDTDTMAIWNNANGGMIFGANAAERMRIASSGNVGIGTTSPSAKLNVSGDIHIGDYGSAASRVLDFRTNNSLFTIATDGTSGALGTTISYSWANGGQGPLKFNNAAGEVMRLSSGGNVGIGTTSPSTKLDVVGAITASGGFFNSDIRLKDLIDYDYNVSDIKPITYLWKDGRDDKKHVGYSAQEVQKIMPYAVNEGTDGMLSVNYVEVLVAKIAQMEKEIELLKSKK